MVAAASLALGAAASCGSRTGIPAELPAPDAAEEIPSIDAFRPDVPVINLCPDAAATLIYVIGETRNTLYSFDPSTRAFTSIGVLACPDSAGTTPFSMAVDRQGVAYVVYSDSDYQATALYRVSTKTGACTATTYDPAANGRVPFGMGFVADTEGGGETLFVSEDRSADGVGDGVLASIDTTTFVLTTVGSYAPTIQQAELTGTGAGQLFAFEPLTMGTTRSFIAQIDPATAKVVAEDPLPGISAGSGWAFGFWGGDFYTFTSPEGSTVVTQFDPKTKMATPYATLPGDIVVGAGVSTCAPQN
jgi:hypothetical protein